MDLFDGFPGIAVLGGVLIGLACGALTLLTGRVMSASDMMGSLLGGAEGWAAASIAFIGGIVAAPLIVAGLGFDRPVTMETSLPLIVVGGLLVGASARLGGASLGGVLTGVARRAPRSLVMLWIILIGATIGGLLQVAVAGGGRV